MIAAVGCEGPKNGESLLGLLEYYEAILERGGLVAREGDIRSVKLGFILDLLKWAGIPENLKSDLLTSIISAWHMGSSNKTVAQNKDELKAIGSSIEALRSGVFNVSGLLVPRNSKQLDIAVMFALPLMPSDLEESKVDAVRLRLRQVMDFFAEDGDAKRAAGREEWRLDPAL